MFFIPQSEITSRIIKRIGQRRAKRLRQAAAESAQQGEGEHTESGELLTAVADALEDKEETVVRDDWSDRRWLSEIIYHFMGRLAGRSQRGGPNTFRSTSCFVDGMRPRLGLHEPEDAALLTQLANEFSWWLSQQENRSFPAGWGRIVGNAQDPESLTFKPLEMGVGQRGGVYHDVSVNQVNTSRATGVNIGRAQPLRDTETEVDAG